MAAVGQSGESKSHVVLVVDPNDVQRDTARDILQKSDYHVLSARDGFEALNMMDQIHVDVVFADTILPKMSGLDLASEIKKNYESTYIILTANDAKHCSSIEAISSDTGIFLDKPVDYNQLLAVLNAHFDGDKKNCPEKFENELQS